MNWEPLVLEIEKRFYLNPGDLMKRSKKPRCFKARQVFYWALWIQGLNQRQISEVVHRHRSTVGYSITQIMNNPYLQEKAVNALKQIGVKNG